MINFNKRQEQEARYAIKMAMGEPLTPSDRRQLAKLGRQKAEVVRSRDTDESRRAAALIFSSALNLLRRK